MDCENLRRLSSSRGDTIATVLVGAVGAAIGSIWGPAGTKLGWAIGSTIGGLIEAQNAAGARTAVGRVADLKFTASSYGTPINQLWGRTKTGGNIVWATDLVEHSHDSGGGKGGGGQQSTSYTYTVSMCISLCRTTTNLKITKIWGEDVVIWAEGSAHNIATPRILNGDPTQEPDALWLNLSQDRDVSNALTHKQPAYRGQMTITFEDMPLDSWAGRIPALSFETKVIGPANATIADVFSYIAPQVGMVSDDYDVTLANTQIGGFEITDRGAAKDIIMPLLTLYNIDPVNVDGKTVLIPRGGSLAGAIDDGDLAAFNYTDTSSTGMPSRIEEKRVHDTELPSAVELTYFGFDHNFEQQTQRAIRLTATTSNPTQIGVNISDNDTHGRRLAEVSLSTAWLERSQFAVSLPFRYIIYAPADCLSLKVGNVTRRMRIISQTLGLPGEVQLSLVYDNPGLLTQTLPGGSSQAQTGNKMPAPVVPTDFVAWSGKELRDADAESPGFYVAACGAPLWSGGIIYYSTDGWVTSIPCARVAFPSVFGVTTSTLADGVTPDTYDASTVTVVTVNGGALASTAQAPVDAGTANAAVIGGEIVGFKTATLTGTSTYDLSDIRRGRRASSMTGHATGEMFVEIGTGTTRVSVTSDLVGTTIQVKVVSPGQTLADVTAQDVTIVAPSPNPLQTQIDSLTASLLPNPYYRVKSYINCAQGDSGTLDNTYFDGGINEPSGVVQFTSTLYANGPGGSFLMQGNINWAIWARLGIKNTTGADINFTYKIPYVDNYAKIVWDGTTEFEKVTTDGSLANNTGTITIPASASGNLDLFLYNQDAGTIIDGGNPFIFSILIDTFEQIGLQFFDPDGGIGGGYTGGGGGGGSYTLPIASASTLGGVKVGSGLAIDPVTGILSSTGTSSYSFGHETPTGTVNGINTAFVFAHTPASGSLAVYVNGLFQIPGVDYTLATATITFTTAPLTGWSIYGMYSY